MPCGLKLLSPVPCIIPFARTKFIPSTAQLDIALLSAKPESGELLTSAPIALQAFITIVAACSLVKSLYGLNILLPTPDVIPSANAANISGSLVSVKVSGFRSTLLV